MNALIYKDFLNLKPLFKSYIFLLAIFGIIFLPMGNEIAVYILFLLICGMWPVTTIGYDHTADWDKYALTMPVSRKDAVKAKYFLTVILVCAAAAAALAVNVLMLTFHPGETLISGVVDPLTLVLTFGSVGFVISSISLPATYHFGPERATIVLILCTIIPVMVMVMLAGFADSLRINFPLVMGTVLVLALACFFVSYRLSVRIYRKKEF
jgi:hypothetical protein